MKRFILLLFFLGCSSVFADINPEDVVQHNATIIYNPIQASWSTEPLDEHSVSYTKNLIEGVGSYSIYNNSDGSLAFALATDCEIVKDGKLIIVDNNLLKYSKLIYEDNAFQQIPLTDIEVSELFPQADIIKVSSIDDDEKMWLHKPFYKKRTILLVNDTEKYFHKISTKSKNVQDENIKGLITFNRYGYFKFKHYGKRNGKLIFYIR